MELDAEEEDYEPLFRPEKIQADREKKKEKEQRAEENPLSQQTEKEDTAALARSQEEIEALRQRLQELLALREFVYQCQREDESVPAKSWSK